MPTPGIFYVAAKITNPTLDPAVLQNWYDHVHFPDIVKTSGMPTTLRYDALDPAADRPFFYYYPVRDLAFLGSDEFMRIPITSDLLPGPSHMIFDFVNFDSRCYELVQTYEPEGTKPGPSTLLISAAMTAPAGADADLDAWYRQEHVAAVAKCSGYRRTRQYRLAAAMQAAMQAMIPGSSKEMPPTWLALHEFDGDALPAEELRETGETEWARRVTEALVMHDYKVYRFAKGCGDVEFGF